MQQWKHASIRALTSVIAIVASTSGLAAAQAERAGPLPVEADFREAVRELRTGLFCGWPSLRTPLEEGADASQRVLQLARPLVEESGSPDGVGEVTLEPSYAQVRIEIARVEQPSEATRAIYEAAFVTLKGWFLGEGGDWLLRDGFQPAEVLRRDSRCASLFPVRRGVGECKVSLWLRKEPIDSDRDEWVLEFTAFGRPECPGWAASHMRTFLDERATSDVLAPFAAWFRAEGFDDDDVVLAVDSRWMKGATDRAVEAALIGLPTRRTARVLVQRGDSLHEVVAPVAGAGPGLIEDLHERKASGEVTYDEYVSLLGGFDWHLVGDVIAAMDDDRSTGFSHWIVGLPGPGGVYRLRPNELSRNVTPRWQRLLVRGDLILLRIVLYHGVIPAPRQLRGYLRNHMRAALQDAGVETLYDLQVSFADERPEGGGPWEFCVDLGLRDATLAAALVACEHVTLEAVSGDCQDGWGVARSPETGETFEGFFERGLPAGVIRRVHPSTGAVLVSGFRGATPHGPFIEFDPLRAIARVGVAENGEIRDVRRIAAWTGADDPSGFHTLDGLENGPVVAARGTVISGDPNDGRCVVEIPGLGKYEGSFVEGTAQGEGVLETAAGRIYKVDCFDGVPRLVRTLKVPDSERYEFWEENGARLLPDGDCLMGDTRRGEGVAFLGYDGNTQQIYRGSFVGGRPHGKGTLKAGKSIRSGVFENGRYVPPPRPQWTAPQPKPKPVVTRTATVRPITTCKSCGGYGYVTTRGYYVDEVEVRPFMPGQRHYGSWVWSGYERKTGRRVWKPGHRIRCRFCGGTGR